jgi:glyoxylase-like metal-dependent hydrolase (beta-lactamase superfamily II)
VTALELGPFQARAVILACEQTGAALLVDPGFEPEALLAEVRRDRLEPAAIVLTHAHLDHAWGVATVHDAFPSVPVLLHADDLPLYRNLAGQAQMFGFPAPRTVPEHGLLADGQELAFGRLRVVIRHAPGHSPGHVVLIHEDSEQPTAVVGDVLFAGSVGRTDLWGGSFPQLERSIREVLYSLPGDTRVVPGHGPETTIAAEIAGNPFVSGYS